MTIRVGLVSDTHGLLRPEALAYLRGSDFIVHAGDIGDPAILDALAQLAPVTAVRGNNDRGAWAARIAATEMLQAGGIFLHALHAIDDLDIDPRAAGVRVVVSGHSHQPSIRERDGVLFVNPGSAGPRRFSLPVTIGELRIDGHEVNASIAHLLDPSWQLAPD